jgi:serine/threonine protein kinase
VAADEPLLDVAAALADGKAVDWSRPHNRSPTTRIAVCSPSCGSSPAWRDPRRLTPRVPFHAPPEILAGQRATPLSDVYSLGAFLYHLVTGAFGAGWRVSDPARAY